jgi:hypothetical protein
VLRRGTHSRLSDSTFTASRPTSFPPPPPWLPFIASQSMSSTVTEGTHISKLLPKTVSILPSAPTLPVELLFIIFDIVSEDSLSYQGFCNDINFPEVLLQLRSPWGLRSAIHPWLRNLRLACRTFKAIIEPPNCFMKNEFATICTTTKAVFINSAADVHICLQRLLDEPSRSHRIVLLDLITFYHSRPGESILQPFDVLCTIADSLPSIRSLILGTRNYASITKIARFWGRLNAAFPYLTCLILRSTITTTYEDPEVVFQHLEILDVDHVQLDNSVIFPVLRHVAFGLMDSPERMRFKAPMWANLESLMVRVIVEPIPRISWHWLPKLKLLGIPCRQGASFARLPASHPLRHLHLYVRAGPDHKSGYGYVYFFAWVKEIVQWYPTVTRVSLSSFYPHERIGNKMEGFNEQNANEIGFTFTQCNKDARGRKDFQILERLPYQPPPPARTKQVIQATPETSKPRPPTHSTRTQQSTPRATKQTYPPVRHKSRAPKQTYPPAEYMPRARGTQNWWDKFCNIILCRSHS